MNLTIPAQQTTPGLARPLNILRDLSAVADLIEICFKENLDASGRNHLDEMRRQARDSVFLNWAPHMIDVISMPLSGFVWEDQGKVVGNVSLIPFHQYGRRRYLIANVATHPDYRRQGIGRKLTEMAMQRAREKGADSLWLHVRDDNPGAIKIYRDLGFRERARRTEWHAPSSDISQAPESKQARIRPRAARDWDSQRNWLERAYPTEMNWYNQQQAWSAFGPYLWDSFYRLVTDIELTQWAVETDRQLRGTVSCRHQSGKTVHVWLASPPKPDPEAVTSLLLHTRRMFAYQRGLNLEYPTGPADETIRAAGFSPTRTLLWMEAPGQQPN